MTILRKHCNPLLLDYTVRESEPAERIVVENESWLAVVPFWTTWPFETLLMPRRLSASKSLTEEGLSGVSGLWFRCCV